MHQKNKYPNTLQFEIINRFLTDKEMADFYGEYCAHRKRAGYFRFEPTEKEWALFNDPMTKIETYQKFWGKLKNKESIYRRLGQMKVMKSMGGSRKAVKEAIEQGKPY